MMPLRAAATSSCLVLALAGCKTSGFSALQSVNPVMLGPITSLGSGPPPYGAPAGAFRSTSADHSALIIGFSEDGKAKSVSVDGAHATSSPNQGDYDVLVTTGGDPAQRVAANRIGCGGFDFNVFFLYFIADAWCETSGSVYPAPAAAAPAGAVAATPPATPPPAR